MSFAYFNSFAAVFNRRRAQRRSDQLSHRTPGQAPQTSTKGTAYEITQNCDSTVHPGSPGAIATAGLPSQFSATQLPPTPAMPQRPQGAGTSNQLPGATALLALGLILIAECGVRSADFFSSL